MSIKSTTARLGVILAAMLYLVPAVSQAGSITTLFAANNGGGFGGAVYFDLTVGSNDLWITGLDTNTAETGGPFSGFSVYTKTGTAFGNETNMGLWALQTMGSLTANGLNIASPVALDSSFLLSANTLYGITLVMPSSAGHDYTNGTGGNQAFANADLSLALGAASNVPFTGGIFNPRVWNGTIHYTIHENGNGMNIPEPGTLALFGLGLVGLGFARRRKAA